MNDTATSITNSFQNIAGDTSTLTTPINNAAISITNSFQNISGDTSLLKSAPDKQEPTQQDEKKIVTF